MSVANGLSLVKIDDNDLNLTELENNLIAKKILFQKVFKLPKTRMAAVKDKLVNIPLNDEDVINTIKNLPRTPTEAGLLEVKLKRKMEYKNYHQYEYISPDKIFKSHNFYIADLKLLKLLISFSLERSQPFCSCSFSLCTIHMNSTSLVLSAIQLFIAPFLYCQQLSGMN